MSQPCSLSCWLGWYSSREEQRDLQVPALFEALFGRTIFLLKETPFSPFFAVSTAHCEESKREVICKTPDSRAIARLLAHTYSLSKPCRNQAWKWCLDACCPQGFCGSLSLQCIPIRRCLLQLDRISSHRSHTQIKCAWSRGMWAWLTSTFRGRCNGF